MPFAEQYAQGYGKHALPANVIFFGPQHKQSISRQLSLVHVYATFELNEKIEQPVAVSSQPLSSKYSM